MISKDMQPHRDRLFALAEKSGKPNNVKRRSSPKSVARTPKPAPQKMLSLQDFVRNDPGYTPNIEHLVFPDRRKTPPKVPSPVETPPARTSSKARSRLAEMFALSRHLQQSSTERETRQTSRKGAMTRSVDGAQERATVGAGGAVVGGGHQPAGRSRRWAADQQPVASSAARFSPEPDASGRAPTEMATTRGPNVSVLHLRSTSEPWETSPTTMYPANSAPPRTTYSSARPGGPPPPLTKHQSLGNSGSIRRKEGSSTFYTPSTTGDLYVSENSCNRELSPVRWCDREVDGVYLGRSGWVQVQHRSLDEKRYNDTILVGSTLPKPRKAPIKLADYHCNSEPGKFPEPAKEYSRPAYLPIKQTNQEHMSALSVPESFSPPPLTPIISPPPAFQDRASKMPQRARSSFGKQPFLPRSNAMVDSDIISPPATPPGWKPVPSSLSSTSLRPQTQKLLPSPVSQQPSYSRIPQTKSMEDATNARRTHFVQRYIDSSSSSSSSLGFRSLDSCMNRSLMPRLSENSDVSLETYEDADDEDNSSSLNLSIMSPVVLKTSAESMLQRAAREKLSPNLRQGSSQQRSQPRRSPDVGKQFPCSPVSSSSSSSDYPSRPPSNSSTLRRSTPRQHQKSNNNSQEDLNSQKVRRSRSLQLPDRRSPNRDPSVPMRVSPQAQMPKMSDGPARRPQKLNQSYTISGGDMNEDIMREAELVTEYLHSNRTRAAAKALLMQRLHEASKDEPIKNPPKIPLNNGYNVYYVGSNGGMARQKSLQRPNLPSPGDQADFWPNRHSPQGPQYNASSMRPSQSYPSTHLRASNDSSRFDSTKKRGTTGNGSSLRTSPDNRSFKRPSPTSEYHQSVMLDCRPPSGLSLPLQKSLDRKSSPVYSKSAVTSPSSVFNSSCSSSNSDLWPSSDRTSSRSLRNLKSSGASTPLEETSAKGDQVREMILTRPGSAPADDDEEGREDGTNQQHQQQQRSLSLPKSFLSVSATANQGCGSQRDLDARDLTSNRGQLPWNGQGAQSLASTPSPRRRTPTPELVHTAPVTPTHDPMAKRSPALGRASRKARASSTPLLIDQEEWTSYPNQLPGANLDSSDRGTLAHHRLQPESAKETTSQKNTSGNASESVLQKFRKTFSLRFQKKGSKDSEYGDEIIVEPPEETDHSDEHVKEETEQKYRFGPLVWRSSKERKKNNKAARSAKCNSGDSGIQIEMAGCVGGNGGDSSAESHDTDQPGDEADSPPMPRRGIQNLPGLRPRSEHLNQMLIDKFKADLQSRAERHLHQRVRRTHSDLGGQRLLQWPSRRLGMSSRGPRRRPADLPAQMRPQFALRRSLSQPLDIDKLSPLMQIRAAGLRLGVASILSEDEHDGRGNTSDDEMESGSESSIASLSERKRSLEMAMDENMVILAEAMFDHVAIDPEELGFRAGDVIEVQETANRDWWWGSAAGRSGWFPSDSVRLRVSQEDTVEDCLEAMASGRANGTKLRRRTSISLLSNDQVRTSVVRELVHTERDFVKVLTDVVEGYMMECRKRTDMFTPEQIQTIYINLEDMLKFQSEFLRDLEACIDWEAPSRSCVGDCFLRHKEGFKMYSDYCNSHPMATAALQELYQYNNYSKFFEACRLMRGLIEIPLDGYLLTPVQRICKYPLQLAELLKYTKHDHADHGKVREALDAMKEVAVLINERKRRMESLEKLAAWQQRVEGWEGEDLIEVSSQLIHQGEAVRVTTGMWTNNITLFLFDRQLVYCKKDILKRNTHVYKGRICLDTSEIIDVADGKDSHTGVTIRHGIKVYSCIRDKWLLFCCRSASDKKAWIEAFSQERKLVLQDRNDGFEFAKTAKQLARLAARCHKRPPRKPRSHKNYKRDSAYIGSLLQLNSNPNSLGRKVGTWFLFGNSKKSRHHRHRTS